ncbi:MAG: prolipoprotein diacylglyceryl transferase [Clostridia bacterium]|nr:prolipoprotein diacylglyceryl transferase [Clostridia bacterium]
MINKNAVENLFGIDGFNIAWYGVIIAFGMLLGTLLAIETAKKKGYKSDLILDFLFLSLPIAILCARAYYVIFEWSHYASNPLKVFAIREGGLAIYGGVIGGFISAVIFTAINHFPLWQLIDMVIPSLILGQAVGRWGNFFNQEAFGSLITKPSLQFFPYGVYIEHLSEWHQATFFYESMWNLILFVILVIYSKKAKYNGDILSRYLIGYGIGRFFIEGLRTDSLYVLPGMRVSQLLSVFLVILGIGFIILRKNQPHNPQKYKGKYSIS